jgi:hypothetical protein
MAVTVKKVVLWRKEVENKPGALANTLEPLAAEGADLKVVMGYRFPGAEARGAVEVYPVAGKKLIQAAQGAGLGASTLPTLLVEGDDKRGLGHEITSGLAQAGINVSYALAQVVGRKFVAVLGFETDADAAKASGIIKKACAPKRR